MTIEEKRIFLTNFCKGRRCKDCPLFNPTIIHTSFDKAGDLEIESFYNIVRSCVPIIETDEKDAPAEDTVNRPSHYTDGKIEVIDYIEDKKLGFCLGNAIKYISRAGKKDPSKEIEDLKKAKWYIERRIKELEEVTNG